MMNMPLVAPLFIADRHFSSTLVLVNPIFKPTFADVVLRGLDGKEIARQRVEFLAVSQQRVDIGDLLLKAGSRATTGSITVMQSPDLKAPAILAQLTMTYSGSRVPNFIDEEIAMPSPSSSQILRSLADRSDGSPVVAVTSLAETVQKVTVQCLEDSGRRFSKLIQLLAGETLLTEACTQRTVHGGDLEAAWSEESEESRKSHVTGIAITSDGMPGSFAAFGLARHEKDADRYFSVMSFNDPKMSKSSTTVFTGVPVDSARLLPEGRYIPHFSLANFADKPAHVTIKYAQTVGGAASVRDVEELTVPARSSKEVGLDILEGDPDLRNSFMVVSDGAPGDLAVKLVSKSESRLREVELEAKDEKDENNGGSHPWTLEEGTESTLLLFNHSEEVNKFTVLIGAGAARWEKDYFLEPMQTVAISVRNLMQNEVKDNVGRTLPGAVLTGDINWTTPDSGVGKGRILQSNPDKAMARNFSCGAQRFVCGVNFVPGITNFTPGDTVGFGSLQVGFCQGPGGCVVSEQSSGSARISWSSASPSVAAISGSNTLSSVNLFGAGPGTSTTKGTATGGGCSVSGGGPANVFAGVLTPQDNFAGRSIIRFGIAETINLDFSSSTTAAALGGLQWSIVSGGGTLTAPNPDGTGTYSAPTTTATVVIRIAVVSGSSKGQHHDYSVTIVAPSGGYLVKSSNLAHTQGFISVRFRAHIYLTPVDVSFARLKFEEGTATAVATGFFASANGQLHSAGPLIAVSGCNTTTGCTGGDDQVGPDGWAPPFSTGDFVWHLPWQYQTPAGGALNMFTAVTHHQTADGNGLATIEKAGAGPFSKLASDPTSTF
jgi:hypothetical protein